MAQVEISEDQVKECLKLGCKFEDVVQKGIEATFKAICSDFETALAKNISKQVEAADEFNKTFYAEHRIGRYLASIEIFVEGEKNDLCYYFPDVVCSDMQERDNIKMNVSADRIIDILEN